MKLLRSLLAMTLVLVLLGGASATAAQATTDTVKPLTILFTHDTHDHFLPQPADGGGEYGGYTRLATALKAEREAAQNPTITVDGGDFSMGSLFQTIFTTDAPELRMLGALGYDVTTMGNHEYDYRSSGLAQMLTAAKQRADEPLPAIVQANYKPPVADTATRTAWENYPITDYTVLERSGLKVAVFGVLGTNADEYAPMSGMEFEAMAEAAQRVVTEIQEREEPDYIVCLSHGGTDPDPKRSEDEQLAKAVDGIDVIISGHTHSTLTEPKVVNGTAIVSCGEYTTNLGVLQIGRALSGGAAVLLDYRLVPIDENVAVDTQIAKKTQQFKQIVDEKYLSNFGMSFDEVLATSPFDFTPIGKFAMKQEDDALGSLISDGYIEAIKAAEGENYVPVTAAVVNSGVIRASIAAGDVTVSDAFTISSLGVGADGTPGYPLISVWLTGKELRDACEVDASVAPIMSVAQLYMSGITYSFNQKRMIFNKITDVALSLPDGTQQPLEPEKLYRVVTGLYSGQMLGAVNSKSFGLLSITPKDAQGNVITDFEAHIVHERNGAEVKEWYALASYLKEMGTISDEYAAPLGRKTITASWNPVELLRGANWITLLVLALCVLLVALVTFITYRIATRRRRRLRKRNK